MKQSVSAPNLSASTTTSTDVVASPEKQKESTSPTKTDDHPEAECQAEFKPVIDLPDLIEVCIVDFHAMNAKHHFKC